MSFIDFRTLAARQTRLEASHARLASILSMTGKRSETLILEGRTFELEEDGLTKAILLSEELGLRLEKADGQAMMLAWYPPPDLAAQLAIPGYEAPEDLHLTLAYIPGDYGAGADAAQAVALLEASHHFALEGFLLGIGRFALDDNQDCLVCLVDIPGLEDFRECLCDSLMQGGVYPDTYTHGFTPHITLAYLPRTNLLTGILQDQVPITIDTLSFASQAGDRVDFPLLPPVMLPEADPDELSGTDPDVAQDAAEGEPDNLGILLTKNTERRYTLGPVYAPNRKDAHGEWVDDELLHDSFIEFMQKQMEMPNGGRLKLMHDTSQESGTIVELMRWPYDHVVKVTSPGGEPRELTMPAGTIYAGVIWDEVAWPDVKSGKIGGFSMGGIAMRAVSEADLPSMGDHYAS